MKISISRQLWFLCFGLLGIILAISVSSHWTSHLLMGQLDSTVNVQMVAIRNMTLADMMHDGIRGVVAESLLAANEKDQKASDELLKELHEKCADFEKYISVLDGLPLKAETKEAIAAAKPSLEKYISQSKNIVQVSHDKGYAEAHALFPAFSESFEDLEKKMEHLGNQIESDSKSDLSFGGWFVKLNAILATVFLFGGGIYAVWVLRKLIREIKGFIAEIREAGKNVYVASERMTDTSKTASSVSSNSAASLEETVASLEELNSMVRLNAENAQQASTLSQASLNTAQNGKQEIVSLIDTMSDLASSSKKMEEIINVIDDIAFQTNLLALNAAVEAARAGEQGKGFAVVAEAVRSLAQRSALAAKDISQMIQTSVDKINYGNGVASRSGESLENIVSSVTKVSNLNTEIATACQEQSTGLGQIGQAMKSLDQSTQQNAQASEEINHSSTEMLHQSEKLETLVLEFEKLTFGSEHQAA